MSDKGAQSYALIPRRVGDGSPVLRQQLRQCFFRAQVMCFALVQFFFRGNARRDGHQAIKAARIEAAILVLCAVIHGILG